VEGREGLTYIENQKERKRGRDARRGRIKRGAVVARNLLGGPYWDGEAGTIEKSDRRLYGKQREGAR